MTDQAPSNPPPLAATFPLSQGEAQTLNECFGTDKWRPGEMHQWTPADRRLLEQELAAQQRKTRWPGTKSFDHGAAYRVEMLARVANRIQSQPATESQAT